MSNEVEYRITPDSNLVFHRECPCCGEKLLAVFKMDGSEFKIVRAEIKGSGGIIAPSGIFPGDKK